MINNTDDLTKTVHEPIENAHTRECEGIDIVLHCYKLMQLADSTGVCIGVVHNNGSHWQAGALNDENKIYCVQMKAY